jgi:Flp pilus assembly protein TadD
MVDTSENKPSTADIDVLIGQAWSQHHHGQNEAAIQAFRQIVERWPEHIDAHYGLSLSLKAAGQKQEAAENFRKARTLVEAALATQDEDNARYQMLARMIDQHLATLR